MLWDLRQRGAEELESRLRAATARANLDFSNRRIRRMVAERLTEKLRQASGVAQRAARRIEDRADALIAREKTIREREDEVFAQHEAVMSTAEQGLDEVEAALRQMSNSPLSPNGAQSAPSISAASGQGRST